MYDADEKSCTGALAVSDREKQLEEKLGTRLIQIWLFALVAAIELLIIVHLARN